MAARGTARTATPKSRWIARLAASGVLVVAIDMTLAPEAPYPACVQDANYAVRWLKANAATWNGDASKIGVYGSSSGGHVAELLAMRPRDPRYNADPSAGRAERRRDRRLRRDALAGQQSVRALRERRAAHEREPMMNNHKAFFKPWETIHESNPQEILERHEKVAFVPLLIMQGALDDNVLPAVQEKFAKTYKAAGGECDYHCSKARHEWVAEPGPQTDRAREMVKAFIARQMKA